MQPKAHDSNSWKPPTAARRRTPLLKPCYSWPTFLPNLVLSVPEKENRAKANFAGLVAFFVDDKTTKPEDTRKGKAPPHGRRDLIIMLVFMQL